MKNHVLRPLFVTIGIVVLILLVRMVYVPKDFGIHKRGYMYGWHRKGNETDWQNFKVKYQGTQYCKDCHSDKYGSIMKSPHKIIPCEDCHGPAGNAEGVVHYDPDKLPKLPIDKTRALCLRCHYPLPYPTSGRANIPSIDPDKHNPGMECVTCHNPHNPMEGLQ
jgi:hypothetical protein